MPLDSAYNEYRPKVEFNAGASPDILHATEHILQPVHEAAVDKVADSPDWILGVLLLIFSLLAWVRVYHFKRLKQLVQASLYKIHVQKILRSNDSLIARISIGLNAIFILSMSLFIYQLLWYYNVELPYTGNLSPFLLILMIVAVVYPLKSMVLWLMGWIFKESEGFAEYSYHVFLLNKMVGLALIPLLVLVTYLSMGQFILLHVGVSMVCLTYLYRLFRGYAVGRATRNLSQFYIFLYLCTLEILPLVLVTRFISRQL